MMWPAAMVLADPHLKSYTEGAVSESFGPFVVDRESGELFKGSVRVHLQEQPFRVLVALLDRPGEVVTRDQLRERLWPDDTFVDFNHALTTAVKKLRRILNDSATYPRYIETLPKRGYRFIAPVGRPQPNGASKGTQNGSLAAGSSAPNDEASAAPEREADRRESQRQVPVGRYVLALAAVAVTVAFWAAWTRDSGSVPTTGLRKFEITSKGLPEPAGRPPFRVPVISPNGRHIAFLSGAPVSRIWIRDLDREQPRALEQTEGATGMFWSPDSQYLVFGNRTDLKRVSVHGGAATTIARLSSSLFVGGTWSPDASTIVFSTGLPPVLYEVPAAGGDPRPLIDQIVTAAGGGNSRPIFLPSPRGSRRVVFGVGGPSDSELFARDLDTAEQVQLGPGRRPVYSPSGHVIFEGVGAGSGIWAMSFGGRNFDSFGEPFPIADSGSRASVSNDGTLVYIDGAPARLRQLVWRDRQGRLLSPIGRPQERIRSPRLSPDGERVAARGLEQGNHDIWIHENGREIKTRVSFDPAVDADPVWLPSGNEISWRTTRQGNAEIYYRRLDRDAGPRPLVASELTERPNDWCPDGSCLVYTVTSLENRSDIWFAERSGEGDRFQARPFLRTRFNEVSAQLSPDGRFLAYCSDESGSYEVYVRAFPNGARSRQISRGGGCAPRWSRDSQELFYIEQDRLIAVPVITHPDFAPGEPETLFRDSSLIMQSLLVANYDVAPDGNSFVLVNTLPAEEKVSRPPSIHLVENWFLEFAEQSNP